MARDRSSRWKLLANIALFAGLALYYLHSRDMTAAVAITIGAVVYCIVWLVKSVRASRRDTESGEDSQ